MTDHPTATNSHASSDGLNDSDGGAQDGVAKDGVANDTTAAGYAAAVRELDELLADLEDDTLDIDLLATKVERASELVQFCRARITAARVHVDQIVANLDQLATESPEQDSQT